MISDQGHIFQTKLETAETQFRNAMEEFLEQQRKVFEEIMRAVPVNEEASTQKQQAPRGHTADAIANEPRHMGADEEDHFNNVYAAHQPLVSSPSAHQISDESSPGTQGEHVHTQLAKRIARHVERNRFQAFSIALVFSMCAHLFLDVHCDMKGSLKHVIGYHKFTTVEKDDIDALCSAEPPPYCESIGMEVWKFANLFLFTFEICYRYVQENSMTFPSERFWSKKNRWWNAADIVLWGINFMEYGSELLLHHEFGPRWKAVNVLRMLRMWRIFLHFPTISNMVYSILACSNSLRCAIVLIVIYTMAFSVFFMQVALYYLEQYKDTMHDDEVVSIITNWNGIFDSFMSLVYAVTGGADWREIAEPFFRMAEGATPGFRGHMVGTVWMLCFTGYVIFTTMGLLNVLVGVFVSQAENLANVSIDAAMERARVRTEEREQDASMLFSRIQSFVKDKKQMEDVQNKPDGACAEEEEERNDAEPSLTVSQIKDACDDKTIRSLYAHLDIDLMNPEQMLKAFDLNRNGRVERSEFITGCKRLRGPSKPVEVHAILELVVQMNRKMNDMVAANRQLVTAAPS